MAQVLRDYINGLLQGFLVHVLMGGEELQSVFIFSIFVHVLRYNRDMKQVLTVFCKLNVSAEQLPKIEETLKAFADVCEYVNKTLDSKLTVMLYKSVG